MHDVLRSYIVLNCSHNISSFYLYKSDYLSINWPLMLIIIIKDKDSVNYYRQEKKKSLKYTLAEALFAVINSCIFFGIRLFTVWGNVLVVHVCVCMGVFFLYK